MGFNATMRCRLNYLGGNGVCPICPYSGGLLLYFGRGGPWNLALSHLAYPVLSQQGHLSPDLNLRLSLLTGLLKSMPDGIQQLGRRDVVCPGISEQISPCIGRRVSRHVLQLEHLSPGLQEEEVAWRLRRPLSLPLDWTQECDLGPSHDQAAFCSSVSWLVVTLLMSIACPMAPMSTLIFWAG